MRILLGPLSEEVSQVAPKWRALQGPQLLVHEKKTWKA